jgi:hypothetical protein
LVEGKSQNRNSVREAFPKLSRYGPTRDDPPSLTQNRIGQQGLDICGVFDAIDPGPFSILYLFLNLHFFSLNRPSQMLLFLPEISRSGSESGR